MYRATFGRLPSNGVEVCSLTHSGPLPAPFLAPGYVVNLIVDGMADLVARGESRLVHRGWVVLADAGELRAVVRRHSVLAVTRSLTFSEARLRTALEERGWVGGASFHFASNTTTRLCAELARLYRALEERAPRLSVETALEEVLDGIAREMRNEVERRLPRHRGVRRVEALLRERFAEDISLRELADEVSLSRPHLLRLFREEMGVPPHAFLIQLRIAHARRLLARGVTLVEASAAVGFYDQSHFTRHFRRLVGVAPGAYVRAVRG